MCLHKKLGAEIDVDISHWIGIAGCFCLCAGLIVWEITKPNLRIRMYIFIISFLLKNIRTKKQACVFFK